MSESRLKPKEAAIRAGLEQGESVNALAQTHGVARSTMQNFIRRHIGTVEATPDNVVRDVDVLEVQVKDLTKRLKQVRSRNVIEEKVLYELRGAMEIAPVQFEPVQFDEEYAATGHEQALLLSDTHAGETVDPTVMDGLGEFNWDILVERMANIQASLLSFAAHRPYPITKLHLWCLGDMLSGSNHHELEVTNEFPAAEQAWRFGMLLGQWIEQLVPYYPEINVTGVVGNHPRLTKQPANKQVFNSFDWLAYKIAEVYLTEYIASGAVTVCFPRSQFVPVEVAGQNVLLFHGDGIKSTMVDVPWGGILRRVAKLKAEYAARGTDLRGFALGHFHQANAVRGPGGSAVWMNGSVKGPDEYCLKSFGSADDPEQLLLTFNPRKRRRTDVSYINP